MKHINNIEKTLYITLDIDWICDEILEHILELLGNMGLTATFFVTHATPVLYKLQKEGFELGIHPNFNNIFKGTAGSTITKLIHDLKNIIPEAVSVRSHSLTRNASLSMLFKEEGFTHESNLFVPVQSGIKLLPYEQPKGLIQLAYNWGDYNHCEAKQKISPSRYLEYPGLKILNFHPIHLFLYTNDLSVYQQAKKYTNNYLKLRSFINHDHNGILRYFNLLVKQAKDKGFVFEQIKNICI